MTEPVSTVTATEGILTVHGFDIPADDRGILTAMIATMRTAAAALYEIPEARYVDPAITWSALTD